MASEWLAWTRAIPAQRYDIVLGKFLFLLFKFEKNVPMNTFVDQLALSLTSVIQVLWVLAGGAAERAGISVGDKVGAGANNH